MPRPTFFIVGAPKCGTTSMHAYLSQHPDVFMARYKEPYHFADFEVSFAVQGQAEYEALFRDAGDAAVIGESSVGYLYSAETARRIQDYEPASRILIMVRDPRQLAVSLHAQMLKTGDEDIVSFAEAYAASGQRRRDERIPARCSIPMMLDYAARARYVDGIIRYREVFGEDRVHVVVLDDLTADPVRVLRGVCDFLGVRPWEGFDLAPRNVREGGGRLPNLTVRKLLQSRPGLGAALRRVVPRPVWELARRASAWTQPQPEQQAPVDDPGLDREIERLEALLGRDLSSWKPA